MSKELKCRLADQAIMIEGDKSGDEKTPYVPVANRILYLAEQRDENNIRYSINTKEEYLEDLKAWKVKATLTVEDMVYTGTKIEFVSDDAAKVQHKSALEMAETLAVGRACAMAGIGVISSIASYEEVQQGGKADVTLDEDNLKEGFSEVKEKKTTKKKSKKVEQTKIEVEEVKDTNKEISIDQLVKYYKSCNTDEEREVAIETTKSMLSEKEFEEYEKLIEVKEDSKVSGGLEELPQQVEEDKENEKIVIVPKKDLAKKEVENSMEVELNTIEDWIKHVEDIKFIPDLKEFSKKFIVANPERSSEDQQLFFTAVTQKTFEIENLVQGDN